MWYAGIDIADEHHHLVVLDDRGQQVLSRQVSHSVEGISQLTSALLALAGTKDRREELACIVETTHGLLISALLEAGFPVYPINPKSLNRQRKPAGAKTDAIDAYLLAKIGRNELAELRRLKPDSPLLHELTGLTRDQDALVQSQTRLVNQLTACLKAYYPVALTLFSKLQQRSTLVFLQTYPTPQAAHAASAEAITATLKQAGHPRFAHWSKEVWKKLRQPSLQADPITTRTKTRLMLALVSQLLLLIEQIAAYDEEIERLFERHPDAATFRGLPGAGKRLAPRLLAGWGDDRERYASAASVQALGGTSPVPFESGKYAKAHKRRACIKSLRNVLYQFAWQSTFQEDWAETYYQRKRQEGKTHSMAVRALANVWVRVIFALWRKRERYEAATFLAAKQAHGNRAA